MNAKNTRPNQPLPVDFFSQELTTRQLGSYHLVNIDSAQSTRIDAVVISHNHCDQNDQLVGSATGTAIAMPQIFLSVTGKYFPVQRFYLISTII